MNKVITIIVVTIFLESCSFLSSSNSPKKNVNRVVEDKKVLYNDSSQEIPIDFKNDLNIPKNKKLLFFAPGLFRTFSYLGVLKIFEKRGISFDAISGAEYGDFFALLFSNYEYSSVVEWEVYNKIFPYLSKGSLALKDVNIDEQITKWKKNSNFGLIIKYVLLSNEIFSASSMNYVFDKLNEKRLEYKVVCLNSNQNPQFKNKNSGISKLYSQMFNNVQRKLIESCDVLVNIKTGKRYLDFADNLENYISDGNFVDEKDLETIISL